MGTEYKHQDWTGEWGQNINIKTGLENDDKLET